MREAEITLLYVHWYLRYSLSYRDLEEMMLERGLQVDHTTIYCWGKPVCSRTGQTLSAAAEGLQRFLESRRDLHQSPQNLDVAVPGSREGGQRAFRFC